MAKLYPLLLKRKDERQCFISVRGRSSGDVLDRVPEALLHRHEEAGQEEAPEGHQAATEPLPRPLLRHIRSVIIFLCAE